MEPTPSYPEDRSGDELAERLLKFSQAHRAIIHSLIPPPLRATVHVDDILQESWISAFQSIGSFRETDAASFDRWLRTIMSRRVASAVRLATQLKRGGRFDRVIWTDKRSVCNLLEFLAVDPRRSPSSDVALRDASEAIRVCMARLPDERRRAIELVVIDGKSTEEAGQILERTADAVRGLVYHGCVQLRQYLGSASQYMSGVSTRGTPEAPG